MEVKLEDIWFSYEGKEHVLKSINAVFEGQGLYILIGPNGSGKTTLLKIIALLYKPLKGKVVINGKSHWDLNPVERSKVKEDIVYVPDNSIMVRGSLEYNVRLGLELRGLKDDGIIEELLRRYKIENIKKSNAKSLSAGQRKIASILRALALRPKVLLLDEPFNSLDSEKVEILGEDIGELSKTTIIILATHYMIEELKDMGRGVYELRAGSIRKLY